MRGRGDEHGLPSLAEEFRWLEQVEEKMNAFEVRVRAINNGVSAW